MLQSICVCWLPPLKRNICKFDFGLQYILLGKILVAVVFWNGFSAPDPSVCSSCYLVIWLKSLQGCWKAAGQNCSDAGGACGQRGAGCCDHRPPWSGMNVLRSLGPLRTLSCCCTACWLLIPCLLQRWSSSLQEDGDFIGANLWD